MHASVFDIDGTLVRSTAIDAKLYTHAVTEVLGPVDFRPRFSDYTHVTDSGILAVVLDDNRISHDADTIPTIKNRFVELLARHLSDSGPLQVVAGAPALLSFLRGSNLHRVAIATGGWRQTALMKLASAGLDVEQIPLATSDDANERTAIMQTALSRLGSNFASITYYGDGLWDRQASADLGWGFVPVGPALGAPERLPSPEEVARRCDIGTL